ncbi:cellobiohydrolaseI [Bimuria novae-zelandiae CBS 107.79]|uniref:Glucanase n=1 Tax=Bimuria novae-zelandiae CBS 107.79 TaxID=1447943 RepID=A0A6A5VVE6_9PLEO|nr:cellobiohydrolaseI [Bimuria novae-zelandiae CBS 107.79]
MSPSFTLFLLLLNNLVDAQHTGTYEPELHPRFPITTCASPSAPCRTLNTSLVMDAEWRWLHKKDTWTNCYEWSTWNTTICPSGAVCAANCALDGAAYESTYGVKTSGANLTLSWLTRVDYSENVGSRVFVLDKGSADGDKYAMWKLLNREIAFEVDASGLPCGLSGSLYLVGMDEDGGMGRYPSNKAGAGYGTGYCDAGCPRDLRFVSGEANVEDWQPNPLRDVFRGTGKFGSCCSEIDIWQANSMANALTAHPCSVDVQTRCEGLACESTCDRAGCDLNNYRLGNKNFYGPGKTVDTSKKFTVITQFITSDDTDSGTLIALRRKYIQNGIIISDTTSTIPSVDPSAGITDSFCRNQKAAFSDRNTFTEKGGMAGISKALAHGMVLVFAITEDQERHMLWLDSNWPSDASPTAPGVSRGACAKDTGHPLDLLGEAQSAKAWFSNVRVGWIGMNEAGL